MNFICFRSVYEFMLFTIDLFHTCLLPFVPTNRKCGRVLRRNLLRTRRLKCVQCACVEFNLNAMHGYRRNNCQSQQQQQPQVVLLSFLFVHALILNARIRNEVQRTRWSKENALSQRISDGGLGRNWTNKKRNWRKNIVAWKMETKFRNRSACMARMSVCAVFFTSFTVQWVFGVAFINEMKYYTNSFAPFPLRLLRFDTINPKTVVLLKIYLPLKNFTTTIYAIYILS